MGNRMVASAKKTLLFTSVLLVVAGLFVAASSAWAEGGYGTTIPELKRAADDAADGLSQAEQELQESQEYLEQTESVYNDAKAARVAAEEERDAKSQAYTQAQANSAAAQREVSQAETAKNTADANKTKAEQDVAKASSDVATARQEKAAADANVATAEQNLANAQAAFDAAKEQINKGSFGFFEEKGAQDALNALNRTGNNNLGQALSNMDDEGKTFTSFTHKGEATDATSLENMKAAIDWIAEGNRLRTTDDLFPGRSNLKVSDVLMAMAQSNTNWSDSHIDHADLCGGNFNTGENVAWNYGSNPYAQWYDKEKNTYLEIRDNNDYNGDGTIGDPPNHVTGHYTNIVDSGYASTGFAISTRKSMYGWTTYGQTFSWTSYNGEQVYTVDAYKERFMEYYNRVKYEPEQNLAAAQQAYDDALAAQEAVQTKLTNAQTAEQQAREALASANQAAAQAQTTLQNAQQALNEAQAAQEAAQAELQSASEAFDNAQLAEETAAEALSHARLDADHSQQYYDEWVDRKAAADQRLRDATDLSKATVTIQPQQTTYDGSRQEPESVTVSIPVPDSDDANEFTLGVDFTLGFKNKAGSAVDPINAAAYTVALKPVSEGQGIEGTGVFLHGSATADFRIAPASLNEAAVTGLQDKTYTGSAITQNPVVKLHGTTLKQGSDYQLSWSNNTNVGEATVKITGKGNYTGSATAQFYILQADIAQATIAPVENQAYTGKEVKPALAVTFGGKRLAEGTDYTVSYTNNIAAGSATATVTGKGNFTGSTKVNFTIKPVDKKTLNNNIKAAQDAGKGVKTSTDGKNINPKEQWTTAAQKKALDDAIAAAQKVANNPSATQSAVDKAAANVKKATDAYNKAKKAGLKKPANTTVKEVPIYWLVHKKTGENLYTPAAKEAQTLKKGGKWTLKGIKWYAPTKGTAVYRLYNPKTGDHHYTKSANEVKQLTKVRKTWLSDFNGKPVFYSGGNVKVYRMYSESRWKANKAGTHRFETKTATVKSLKPKGWADEGALLMAVRAGNV